MSRRLADRAADVKRRSTDEWKEKRREGILFLEQNAAYLADKLHANADFTRRNPMMNPHSCAVATYAKTGKNFGESYIWTRGAATIHTRCGWLAARESPRAFGRAGNPLRAPRRSPNRTG